MKTAHGGYDGKGQHSHIEKQILKQAEPLFEHGACVAEALVPFTKEISVIVQRNANGETYCFPVGREYSYG